MSASRALPTRGNAASTCCEAALRFGWDRWLGERGGFVGMTGFGATGPAEVLYNHFGITPEAIVAEARRLLAHQPETAPA